MDMPWGGAGNPPKIRRQHGTDSAILRFHPCSAPGDSRKVPPSPGLSLPSCNLGMIEFFAVINEMIQIKSANNRGYTPLLLLLQPHHL